ncbi:MAG TPA: TIR domain-containing protein [Steroidobacteraceae bacterium]
MTEPSRAVFLSYASQDAEAARRICEALRAGGVEVWLDTSDLRGGDSWDQKIRRQIRDCALFVPVISATTQDRAEGYFRREWKMAVERTNDISDRVAFLVPVVIDDTTDRDADVPEAFRNVQWTRLPDAVTPSEFVERIAGLMGTTATKVAPSRPISTAPPKPTTPPPAKPTTPARPSAALVVTAAAAVLAIGYLGWQQFRASRQSTAATTGAPESAATATAALTATAAVEQSVAVLPFVDMSEKKDQEYFSDGLSEELIDMLSKVPDLHVPARTSSFYFKGKNETIETIAKQLKVTNLLEGSVRKAGNRLRITAQLIRADNGFHLWSETYDRDAKDIFKVQDEIAAAVVEALKIKLAPGHQAASSHRTSNTEAYNEYLLGRQFFSQGEPDSLKRSIGAYKRAVALDSSYAAAYAGLAFAESYLADVTGDSPGLERAKVAAETAIALAPTEADGYAARGFLRFDFAWDWPGSRADLEKAVSLDPSDSDARRRYGDLLVSQGQHADGIAAIKKALELDPLSSRTWGDLANSLIVEHDYDGARESLRRALEIAPQSSYILSDVATLQLLEGKPMEALGNFRRSEMDAFRLPGIAMAEHSLGHHVESQRALDETIAKTAMGSAYQIAEAFAWRGDKDKAFEWLERAYRQRDGGLVTINSDPLMTSLRADPRYKVFLRKMNLPE